ncbi:MAG: hypothetical protein KC546_18960, partial [Anaerolineae bacterium]|nr:hypothetical protein [Anaerolineae bacterium]
GLDDAGTWYSVSRTAIATLIMAVVLWVINQVMPTEGFVVAIVGGIIGGGVFFVAAWVLGVPEVLDLLRPVLRRIPVLRRLTA